MFFGESGITDTNTEKKNREATSPPGFVLSQVLQIHQRIYEGRYLLSLSLSLFLSL